MLQLRLDSWYKFIPRAEKMLPKYRNPCWYSNIAIPQSWKEKIDGWTPFSGFLNLNPANDRLIKIVSDATASQSLQSHHLYCLHSFLEISFPKCGSTSLYNLIGQHGDVANPQIKEGEHMSVFSEVNDPLILDYYMMLYANRFQNATSQIANNPQAITHDGSTWTVCARSNHECLLPVLLSRVLPKTKLIVVMRNPVHRVWSHFWFSCWSNQVPGNKQKFKEHGASIFHDLTVKALSDFKHCTKSGIPEVTCADRTSLICKNPHKNYHRTVCHHVQIGISMYYLHLVNWFSAFNRDQIFFLRTEDLATNQLSTVTSIWKFLDLRDPLQSEVARIDKLKQYLNTNDFAHTPSGPVKKVDAHAQIQMLPETYKILDEFFRPYNQKLATLLNDQRFLWQST